MLQPVAQLEEMQRVLRRVVEHPLAQRPQRPVRALMLLVELHAEVALEERGQPERLEAEQLRGDPGVEDVADVPAVILVQEAEVVVRIVKDDLDVRILEERAQTGRAADRNRVDDGRLVARRKLKEVDSVDEAVEAGSLGIERQNRRTGNRGQERVNGTRRVEIDRCAR